MKQYNVIYADPPWRYSFSKTESRTIEGEYPTMTLADICDLDVPSADNAVLYMWTTAPKLLEAFAVIEAWGFEYKTHAIWDKELLGMGYWFRGQHEILIVATKGQFSPPEQSLRIGSVIRHKRNTKHSAKPMVFRELINKWFPDATKLEMFARTREGMFGNYEYDGWDVFGNQVIGSIQIAPKGAKGSVGKTKNLDNAA